MKWKFIIYPIVFLFLIILAIALLPVLVTGTSSSKTKLPTSQSRVSFPSATPVPLGR